MNILVTFLTRLKRDVFCARARIEYMGNDDVENRTTQLIKRLFIAQLKWIFQIHSRRHLCLILKCRLYETCIQHFEYSVDNIYFGVTLEHFNAFFF